MAPPPAFTFTENTSFRSTPNNPTRPLIRGTIPSPLLNTVDAIDSAAYSRALHAGFEGIQSIGSAKVGDKTLLDTLVPAIEAFDAANADGKSFAEALDALVAAAEAGRDSTLNLVAKIGRASRLGERSLGVLDAGATSCAIILKELSEGARARLQ